MHHKLDSHSKACAIRVRRNPRELLEDLAESRGVLVADIPGKLVDRATRQFKRFARLGDPHVLNVLGGFETGRARKPAQEGPFAESRDARELRQVMRASWSRMNMVLGTQDSIVAMLERRQELCKGPLRIARRVDQQKTRGGKHDARPYQTLNQCQTQVRPRQNAARRNDIAIIENHMLVGDINIWKALRQLPGKRPVGSHPAPVEEPARGEHEGTGADRTDPCAGTMLVLQPGGFLHHVDHPVGHHDARWKYDIIEAVRLAGMTVPDADRRPVRGMRVALPMGDTDKGSPGFGCPLSGDPEQIGQPVDRGQLTVRIGQKPDFGNASHHTIVSFALVFVNIANPEF